MISIIIPTLNEEENLEILLRNLADQSGVNKEIIVADGGSHDRTLEVAEQFNVRVVKTEIGRGRQMNRAAEIARGDYLLFLHADSLLESATLLQKALDFLKTSILQRGDWRVAGHFGLKFKRETQLQNMAYRYIEEKSFFNRVNTTNGDQGLLIKSEFFRELDSFEETFNFLEDQEIAERIRQIGTWITLPGRLVTSARRFEREGFHRRYILMGLIMGLYSSGFQLFFERGKDVYPVQDETDQLQMTPYFELIWSLEKEVGVLQAMKAWYRVGTYVRSHSWQMFYFFDVMFRSFLGAGRYPFLMFHDKVFWPLTNFKICNLINTVFLLYLVSNSLVQLL